MGARGKALWVLLPFFLLYTGPVEDGDFFWHLATGRWIWEHRALPERDPFTWTAALGQQGAEVPANQRFTLKSYWLGQLGLYGLWSLGGSPAVVLARAAVYTGILLLLLLWALRSSGLPAALLAVAPLGFLLREFPSERPQLLTFLFAPLALLLLERLRTADDRRALRAGWPLPLLMVLWANAHGGYLLGLALIGAALLALAGEALLRRGGPRPRHAALLAAAAASAGLNPLGFMALRHFQMSDPAVVGTITEYLSPVQAALKLQLWFPAYWAFWILALAVVARSFRRIPLFHLLVVAGLGGLSLTALRHMPLFLMTGPLLAPHSPPLDRLRAAAPAVLAIVLAAALYLDRGELLQLRVGRAFPEQAVAHLKSEGVRGRLFNHYDWGGYLAFFLPGTRVFIDGRVLNPKTSPIYDAVALSPGGTAALGSMGVGTVVFPRASPSTRKAYPLAGELDGDPAWAAVHRDEAATVWKRKGPE